MEQDYGGIEKRYYPMRGFDAVAATARFCSAHDGVRDLFRHRTGAYETVPLAP